MAPTAPETMAIMVLVSRPPPPPLLSEELDDGFGAAVLVLVLVLVAAGVGVGSVEGLDDGVLEAAAGSGVAVVAMALAVVDESPLCPMLTSWSAL